MSIAVVVGSNSYLLRDKISIEERLFSRYHSGMTARERFQRTVMPTSSDPPDRLPMVEWTAYWSVTLDRWHSEGLSSLKTDPAELRREMGLDRWLHHWVRPKSPEAPKPEQYGGALVRTSHDYAAASDTYLFPTPAVDARRFSGWAEEHEAGDAVVWITLEGFFWFPRTLFGIEGHLYAFYDAPEIMKRMNQDVLEFNLRAIEEFVAAVGTPDFATIAEDMSFNHGPMLSQELFDEFLAPYYRQLTAELHKRGIIVLVDSDGDVTELVPWLEAVGVDGILPLERASHVDAVALRSQHPDLVMLGAFDKRVMQHGEEAMREEFRRLLPAMKSGRFVPSVDHQTPPDVSLENYRLFVSLLREYAIEAVDSTWGTENGYE